ncbi:Type IV secretion-system coupling protein DNA-binding domain-containing protein [Methylophilus rhizosphaerae]|uniref:Type IV secretion-system coupling protein DNA-binding domain-containing protein n=1 Tax=Methylophilus rhizosphaerae TaxID=492660 RepID=A0A1G9A7S1_9PROT|nr:type IV secretion system DNA-binding domain-containing protein [Methylophilus rhizosphaerae]SDK23338.1 Type IV secretion-system coupling protein DNA-binding domain-containing protein [Methylophilus rhizosphaerae]
MANNIKTVVRFIRDTSRIDDGNTQVIYLSDMLYQSTLFAFSGFFIATAITWYINPSFFPTPPATEFVDRQYLTHLTYWFKIRVHDFIPFFYKQEVARYFEYLNTLQYYKMDYTLYSRVLFGYFVGAIGIVKGVFNVINNPIKSQVEVHKSGLQLWELDEAEEKLFPIMEKQTIKHGKFSKISNTVYMSIKRFFTHTILIGASGTGKSQFLSTQIRAAQDMGLKVVVLDPKYEFTSAYYKGDGTDAILDPTDSRSYVWDFPEDNKQLGLIKKFFAALIAEGKDPMWSNSARAVGVGLFVYLMQTFKDDNGKSNYDWSDMKDVCLCNDEELLYIMENYYPEALDFVGSLNKETGAIEKGKTAEGIMINFKAFLDPVISLARFWYETPENPRKKISLYKFMTDPDYPIKTIYLKPNDSEGAMSSGLIRAMLTYMISLLDSPSIPNSITPRGAFFLDEFHAPGKLVNETGQPIIDKLFDRGRSKGWAGVIATQNLIQAKKIYTQDDIDSWRETSSNLIVTGVPIGDTASKLCELMGDELIDKLHTSLNKSNGSTSIGLNYQEHSRKTIFPSELSAKLEISDTHIRYLGIFRGIKDVYILEKPFENIEEVVPHWMEQPQLGSSINKNSRFKKVITSHINDGQTSTQIKLDKVDDKVMEKQPETFEEDLTNEVWVDTGQHMEEMSEEERKFNEENVIDEASKEVFIESLTDTHSASLVIDMLDKIKDKQLNPHSNSFLQRYQERINK